MAAILKALIKKEIVSKGHPFLSFLFTDLFLSLVGYSLSQSLTLTDGVLFLDRQKQEQKTIQQF